MKDHFRGVKSGINDLKCRLMGVSFLGNRYPVFVVILKIAKLHLFYKTGCQCYYQSLVMITGYSEEEHFLLHLYQCSAF